MSRARTVEYFGRLARTYGGGEYYTRRREAVAALLAQSAPTARAVLDLGCGNGRYLAEFYRLSPGALIVGADLSAAMLTEVCRQHPEAHNLVQADAALPPFRAHSFDLVFCSHVLQFLAEPAGAVSEIALALRPGGMIVATVGGTGMREHLRSMALPVGWEEFQRVLFGRRRERGSSRVAFNAAFAAAGLAITARAAPFRVTWRGFVEWLEIRWFAVMPQEERERAHTLLDELERSAGHPPAFNLSEELLFGRKPR